MLSHLSYSWSRFAAGLTSMVGGNLTDHVWNAYRFASWFSSFGVEDLVLALELDGDFFRTKVPSSPYDFLAFRTVMTVWSSNSRPPFSRLYPGQGTPCLAQRSQPGRPSSHRILRLRHWKQPGERTGILFHMIKVERVAMNE